MPDPQPNPPSAGIVSERLFDGARDSIFQAFADPTLLAQWWGPKGFTNAFTEFDFRPGGFWRFVMHGPDGAEYPLTKRFLEVVPEERIVLRQLGGEHEFQMSITFADEGARTRIRWEMHFDSAAEEERVRGFVSAANEENFDRLEALLAQRNLAYRPSR